MPLDTAEALVDALRGRPLLTPEQFADLTSRHAPANPDPQDLARALIRLRWLNVYQAKKLLAGKGNELFVGQYVILDKLGEGGMGKVYKAVQTSLGRVVALKVVRSALLKSDVALKRFRREVKSAAALSHPNIVRVFDADQTGDRHFLAMEYIAGADLTKLVRIRGPLAVPVACSYIRQAALGLQHAHDRGMVHRDIKPSNLLVAAGPDGLFTARGPVKILDMGLARMQDVPAGEETPTELTQTGTVVGTPDFMSPEQAKNSSQVDHRSDLYSLGCTFYFLLTGDVPFPIGNPLEKLLQHQMDQPRPLQLVRMDVPTEVATIVQTLLAKKPDQRFQSGAALAHALEAWEQGPAAGVPAGAVLVAEAADPSSATVETPPEDPFDFSADPDPITPDSTRQTPAPTVRLGPWPGKRPPAVWVLVLAALVLVFLVSGAIGVGLLSRKARAKPEDPPPSPGVTEPPRAELPKKADPPPARDLETLEKFLPNATTVVAIADVKLWQTVPQAKPYLLEPLTKKLADLSRATGTDLPAVIERIGLAVVGADDPAQLFIAQGRALVTPRLIDGLKAMPGVAAEAAWAGGPDLLVLPGANGEDRQFVAFSETSAFLSPSRALVVEAVKKRGGPRTLFADPTLARGLTVSHERPFAVFVAVGCRSGLTRAVPELGGLNAAAGGIFFEERGLIFGVLALESEPGKATEARKALGSFLAEQARTGAEPNLKMERIARLVLDADPGKFPGLRRGLHAVTIVPPTKLAEWFGPFLGKP